MKLFNYCEGFVINSSLIYLIIYLFENVLLVFDEGNGGWGGFGWENFIFVDFVVKKCWFVVIILNNRVMLEWIVWLVVREIISVDIEEELDFGVDY